MKRTVVIVAVVVGVALAAAYNNRGWVYKKRAFVYAVAGELDRAIADFDEAIRLDPKDADTYRNRGLAYNSKGSYDLAIVDFNEAIRLDPKNAVFYTNRGNVYNRKGDYDQGNRVNSLVTSD